MSPESLIRLTGFSLQKRFESTEWIRTRALATVYRDEAVKTLRACKAIPYELESDTFLAAATVLTSVSVSFLFCTADNGAHPWFSSLHLTHRSGLCRR